MSDYTKDGCGVNQEALCLVRKSPSAVEKIGAGAKRLVSGIVGDTLALAKTKTIKPVLSVLAFKFYPLDAPSWFESWWSHLIEDFYGQQYETEFQFFTKASELVKLARDKRFDLIVLYYTEVEWDVVEWGVAGHEPFDLLASLNYGKRIIVMNGTDSVTKKCQQAGCVFVELGSALDQLHVALQNSFAAPPAKIARQLQIVIVDDEEGPRSCYKIVLQNYFCDPNILEFSNGDVAWAELLREYPDLLISDLRHLGMNGLEMLEELAKRKANFPIFVFTAFETTESARFIAQCQQIGLKLFYRGKPWDLREFQNELFRHFGPSENPKYQPAPPSNEPSRR